MSKVTIHSGTAGVGFQLKPGDKVDTAAKDCPITEADVQRMLSRGMCSYSDPKAQAKYQADQDKADKAAADQQRKLREKAEKKAADEAAGKENAAADTSQAETAAK